MRALTLGLFVCSLAIGGCRDSGGGNLVELDGKIFVFNYRVATATYLVNLKPVRPVASGIMAVATFEDPAGGAGIVVREKVWPNSARTTINSPPLSCIVKDRPYKVMIRIEDAGGQLLQQIDTTVTSSEDQSLLPDKPLVVGPLYTPNPDTVPAAKPPCPAK